MKPSDSYEYHLFTWGGFYNEEHRKKHGLIPGNHWFKTYKDREDYCNLLKDLEKQLNAKSLAFDFNEGYYTRYKSIIRLEYIINNKSYYLIEELGVGFTKRQIKFLYLEGNYSCDCSITDRLSKKYPEIKESECDNKIPVKIRKIKKVKI